SFSATRVALGTTRDNCRRPTRRRRQSTAAYPPLVSRFGGRFSRLLLILWRELRRPEVDGQLVDRAVEGERRLVVLVVHSRAQVDPDVERFVRHLQERDRVGLLPRRDGRAVHLQHTGAALGDAGAVI